MLAGEYQVLLGSPEIEVRVAERMDIARATQPLAGGNTIAIYGTISGSGGLTKIGGQTAYLGAPNTYSGPTNVNYGTLALNGGGAPGAKSVLGAAAAKTADVGAPAAGRAIASEWAFEYLKYFKISKIF